VQQCGAQVDYMMISILILFFLLHLKLEIQQTGKSVNSHELAMILLYQISKDIP